MSDFKTVATVGEIEPNTAIIVNYGRDWVLLFNLDDGYYAIEDRCSHEEVELSGGEVDLATCEITCPKHGARFDIKTGQHLAPPAVRPIRTYAVRVVGDDIQIARK